MDGVIKRNKKDRRKDKGVKRGRWKEFATRTSLHGMKVCGFGEGRSKCRRFILLSLVIINVVFFLHQLIVRCFNYSLFPSHVNVQVSFQKFLEFPSVTVCNQNKFRISQTLEMGAYPQVMKLQKSKITNLKKMVDSSHLVTENLTEFVLRTSHLKHDFIYSCTWAGQPCDLEDDLRPTVTEFFTLCYTYNWNGNSIKKVNRPGVAFSLRLKLNIESYEYFDLTKNNLGVKVLIHPKSELPQVGELGFSVPPGTHTLVGILPVISEHLPEPWGTCQPQAIPRSRCFAEMKKKKIEDLCECVNDMLLENHRINNTYPSCNVSRAFECAGFNAAIDDIFTDIECPVPCSRMSYMEEVSYAHLSRLNVRQMKERDGEKYEHLRRRLKEAVSSREVIKSLTSDQEIKLFANIFEHGRRYVMTLEHLHVMLSDKVSNRLAYQPLNVPDHRLSTDESLLNDLKYLFEDYQFKKMFLQFPQPELKYFILFVKLICGFTETDFWIGDKKSSDIKISKVKTAYDNNGDNHYDDHISDDDDDDDDFILSRQLNPKEQITIESLLSKCAKGGLMDQLESINNSINGNKKSWVEFYSCNDDDIFTYLGVRRIQLRNALVMGFEEHALVNLKTATTIRNETSQILFGKTTYDTFLSSNKNLNCLAQLNKMSNIWINRTDEVNYDLKAYLHPSADWSTKLKIYFRLKDFLNILKTSEDSIFNEINFIDCHWNFRNDSTLMIKNPFANSHFGFFLAYMEATETSFLSLNSLNHRIDISRRIITTIDLFRNISENISNNFEKFINYNLSRNQLLNYVGGFYDISQPLMTWHDDILSQLTSFLIKLTSYRSNTYQAYFHMTKLPLPLLNDTNLNMLQILKIASDQLINMTNKTKDSNLTTTRESTTLQLINYLYRYYESIFEESQNKIDLSFKLFYESLGRLKDELTSYSSEPDLNENFFRENLVKLDIFFKDVKMKKIQQKPTASILTLFSEVGSGMSLLLGASVLTFCEVIDFVLELLTSTVKEKLMKK